MLTVCGHTLTGYEHKAGPCLLPQSQERKVLLIGGFWVKGQSTLLM
jgi:hypothetical protein